MGDSWASMVNTPLLSMFQKPSSSAVNNNNDNATSHGQTVELATAKLNDLYGAGNVPRLDSPEKFPRYSKGHMNDITSGGHIAVKGGATNNGVYGDDGDLISGHRASSQGGSGGSLRNGGRVGGRSNWPGAQSPALPNTSGRFGGSDASRSRYVNGWRRRWAQPRTWFTRTRRHALGTQHGPTGTAERDERDEPIQHEHARHGESQRGVHTTRGSVPCGAVCRCWRRVWTGWSRARRWTRQIRGDAGGGGRGGPGRSGGRSLGPLGPQRQRQERLIRRRRKQWRRRVRRKTKKI